MSGPAAIDRPRSDEWRAWSLEVRTPADRRVLAAAMATAAATDLAWHSGLTTLGGSLLILVTASALLATRRVTNPQAVALAAAAPTLGVWFALRTSPWLLVPDVAAVAGLLVMAASLADRGSLLDVTIPAAVVRALHAGGHGLGAVPFASTAARQVPLPGETLRRRWREVLAGALLALPVIAALVALLASADAVFAYLVHVDLHLGRVVEHLAASAIGFVTMCGLIRTSSAVPLSRLRSLRPRLGPVEITIVLGGVCTTFAVFAAAQLIALSEGGRRVIETAGLTYAQYARSGFFQLVAVAGLALLVMLSLRAVTDLSTLHARRLFIGFSELAVALTLVVVFVAVRRMNLYEDTYGLTMLRLYAKLFCFWIGAVLVLTGLWILGVGRSRHWVPSLSVAVALAGLLTLNAVNPEAVVVRHNVAHASRTGRFDPSYAAALSSDAVPTLIELLPRLDPPARHVVLMAVCQSRTDQGGWASWNWSIRREAAAQSLVC